MKRILNDRFLKPILLFALNFPSITIILSLISITWIIAIPIWGPTLCDCGLTYHQNVTAAISISLGILFLIGLLNIDGDFIDASEYLDKADKILNEIENEKNN
jgi:hypothetical protein